jgi:hypothetical protein
MRTIKLLGSALLALMIAGVVSAGEGDWVECGSTRAGPKQISKGTLACYEIDATDYADMTTSFTVGNQALICLNPDVDTEGADDAEVMIHYCPIGLATGVAPNVNACFDILDSPLDGTTGSPDTQNACVRVPAGVYWIEVTTAPGAGDEAVISVRGE